MEMNGIDLTKYNNLQFKAVVGGSISTDTIRQDRGTFLSLTTMTSRHYVSYEDLLCLIEGGNIIQLETVISDFEIIPRDPETYRDWQVGDIIGFEDENGEIDIIPEHLCRVIFRSGELVAIADNCEDADINGVYTCSQIYREGWRLIFTDIEKWIIEERKKAEWEPQDGDIVAWKDEEDNGPDAVSIYKGKDRGYATMLTNGDIIYSPYATFAMNIIRPATEEEKQKLFDAMAKEGKRWNAEKKVVEDIPKHCEFKKGEPVLVRDVDDGTWHIAAFVENNSGCGRPFYATGGIGRVGYYFCLPYNEKTMYLLGTSNDYKEE